MASARASRFARRDADKIVVDMALFHGGTIVYFTQAVEQVKVGQ